MTSQPRLATSSHQPSRRTVLKGAAVTAAAGVMMGAFRSFDAEAAAAPASNGVFGYGVASGDPTAHSLIIWTRATPPTRPGQPVATPGSGLGAPITVEWEVSRDQNFHRCVARGRTVAAAASDHTVKVDVGNLDPYTRYYYRFSSCGQTSPVGITQTAPDDERHQHALRFALISCSNYTGGYFGPYRAIGQRDDIDFVLHVGDYIYEYGNGADRYGPAALIGVRDGQPATETIDLAGYRLRHALHKSDPDLQLAHGRHPFITIFDDHEVANNTWATGAENHTPGVEGDFLTRRRQAYQAYLEWMPFRLPEQRSVPHEGIRFFKRFTFGNLADLSILETRQNRSEQIDFAGFTTTGGGFIPTGLNPAVDTALADPNRHLPEPQQMEWLKKGIAAKGHRWHLLGNQVIMTPLRVPGAVFGALLNQKLPDGVSLLNSDQWDGYQADQNELIQHMLAQPSSHGDTVVLTGDIHASFAMEIPGTQGAGYHSAGVEFVCPSVTSDGFYETALKGLGAPVPVAVAAIAGLKTAVQATNPWVKYLDGVGHGFVLVDVTPARVQADYYLTPVPTLAQPDPRVVPTVVPTYAASYQTLAGTRSLSPAATPIGSRSDSPH